MNVSQNSSSLSFCGKAYLDSLRGKIKAQPTAVSRRKFKNGSEQEQDTTREEIWSHNVMKNNISYQKRKSFTGCYGKSR